MRGLYACEEEESFPSLGIRIITVSVHKSGFSLQINEILKTFCNLLVKINLNVLQNSEVNPSGSSDLSALSTQVTHLQPATGCGVFSN